MEWVLDKSVVDKFVFGKSVFNISLFKATPYNGVQEIRHLSKWINGEKNNQISCVKASQIRQSGKACQPESGLLTRTSYSVWRFAFADLGIGSFDIEAAA